MREKIYLERLEELIDKYNFNLPLSIYLRQEFHKRRNMGSRDRRRTREDIYSFFRIGINYSSHSVPERVALGIFICNTSESPEAEYILREHSPFDISDLSKNIEYKLQKVKEKIPSFEMEKVFPFTKYLSNQIEKDKFQQAFFHQPLLWIRVRKKFLEKVILELNEKKISFGTSEFSPLSLSFANSTPVHELQSYEDGFFEIQDLNSQRSGHSFEVKENEAWLDACAGAGGKSLLLLDKEPGIFLTATDSRGTSLKNLRDRMSKASLRMNGVILADLSLPAPFVGETFDGIIADVPCSGSGTWVRSPEMLSSFDEKSILEKYVPIQRKIIENLTPVLKKGGKIIYITCSAFKQENEDNISHFTENSSLKCISSNYFEGADLGADTMFVAVLEK